MAVLVAGGAGYIGSHTAIELLESGYEVVIVDNLSNSNSIVVDRIKELSKKPVKF
ncbi:UDP-glucose 4-epimerase GalE, partial [Clostridioides difficile]